ncbi:diguanylate cyclase [Deltaproteobacteria bacterium TL4]
MKRISLKNPEDSAAQEHPDLETLMRKIHKGRYFKKMRGNLLKHMIRESTLVYLAENEYLLREGETDFQEMYILVEGSLAVMSRSKFILRLEMPGDVVGEMAVIDPAPRSADVIAEKDCQLIAFSAEMFQVDEEALVAPITYVMFAHVLAEKLRITTAQSLLHKNDRVSSDKHLKVALIDASEFDRDILRGVLEKYWSELTPVEYTSGQMFLNNPLEHRFTMIIVDIECFQKDTEGEGLRFALSTMKLHGAPIFVISEYCKHPLKRDFLRERGVEEQIEKPYAVEDVIHRIEKFRVWHYKQRELDRVEHAADTDQLTGIANRRRMDEYLEALITLYPDKLPRFSFIITDVDNFKHYNDTNGHQMGDVVLSRVASILAKNIRKGDMVARFGGEEFVVILPGCSLENAHKVAEKLRLCVEKTEFPNQKSQPTGNLTATFGVSSYPPAKTITELIEQADHCLYRGKEAGRNVVVLSEPN